MSNYKNIKEGATIGDLYNPAIEIAKEGNKEAAKEYFDALVEFVYERSKIEKPGSNMDRIEAAKIVHSNIGYYSGYFEIGTIKKVYEVFGSAHPVFGSTTPSAKDAFEMGKQWAKDKK